MSKKTNIFTMTGNMTQTLNISIYGLSLYVFTLYLYQKYISLLYSTVNSINITNAMCFSIIILFNIF